MVSRSPAEALTDVCAGATFAVGVAVVAGWRGHISLLGGAFAHGPEVRPVTGLCLMTLAVMLIVARRWGRLDFIGARRTIFVAALAVVSLGAVVALSQLVLAAGTQRPGSPHTISTMVLFGLAIVLSLDATRGRRQASVLTALAGTAIPWTALLGYVTSTPSLYAMGSDYGTGMSVVSALALLLVSAGIMGLYPDHGFAALLDAESQGGVIVRVVLPSVVFFPLAVGALFNHAQSAGWLTRDTALVLNLGISSGIIVTLVLWISLLFKRRESAERAAKAERERLLRSLQASIDELQKLQSGLVTVCAWTQRVLDEGKWVRFEEFLDKRLHIAVSHSISEEAAQEELQSLLTWMATDKKK